MLIEQLWKTIELLRQHIQKNLSVIYNNEKDVQEFLKEPVSAYMDPCTPGFAFLVMILITPALASAPQIPDWAPLTTSICSIFPIIKWA